MKKCLSYLLRSLLMLQISFIPLAAYTQEQVLLKENQKAKFQGVLVPEPTYKKLVEDAMYRTEFEQALTECRVENDDLIHQESNSAWWFAAGAALGITLVVALKK